MPMTQCTHLHYRLIFLVTPGHILTSIHMIHQLFDIKFEILSFLYLPTLILFKALIFPQNTNDELLLYITILVTLYSVMKVNGDWSGQGPNDKLGHKREVFK